jgi:DNA-binding transcriptional MerR regulator
LEPEDLQEVPREPERLLRIVEDDADGDEFNVLSSGKSTFPNGWLFHPDELLLPETPTSYRKPVAAIHAIPEKRDASFKFSARKLMEALPLAVQLDLRSRRKEDAQELVRKIREDRATPLFEIRTRELARMAGLMSTNLERVHDTLAEMVGQRFIWNVMGEDGQAEYEAVAPFLIRRDKGVGRKAGYTRFAFEPEILLWFLEPKMWANLSWAVMSSIGPSSGPGYEAAFGLYQNVWRYIGTSAKVTPTWDVADWIELILGRCRFVKEDAKGVKQVVDYKDFKRRYLVPGLAILNNHPALNHTVEMKEDLSGRKVVRLRFRFIEKAQGSFDLPLGWPPASITQLEELGFSQKDIATMSQLYPYNQVADALKRLPSAEQRVQAKGSRVYSRKAFFNGILSNVSKGETQTAEDEAKLFQQAVQHQQKETENKRMQALQSKFSTHQRSMIAAALQSLPDGERTELVQAHLKARPEDRIMFRAGEFGTPYLVLFCKWLAAERADLYEEWLPEPKDQNFQSWLAWQLTSR